MAEVVGLAASILAILGAADSALRMAKSMKRLSRDLGAARKDIRNFSRDIDAFSSIIGAAHYTLATHSKPAAPSKVLVFIQERRLLDQLVDQSERVIEHIEDLRPNIKSLKSKITLITRIRWLMQRTDVKALGPKMESVKTSLNLVMSMVMYEALMQSIGREINSQGISISTQREMKRLKRDMARFMEQMIELQQRQQRQPLQNWEESPGNTFVDVQLDIQEALVELGQSIVENDTVPDVEDSFTTSGTLRPDVESYSNPSSTERSHSSSISSRRTSRHRRSPPVVNLTRVAAPPTSRQQQCDEQEASETESAESSDFDPGEGPSTRVIEREEESPVPNTADRDGDFISVQKTSRKISFDPTTFHETISGYIAKAKGNGAHPITALVDRDLAESIISLGLVTKLGLEIITYDSDYDKDREWKWIRVGNAEMTKSRGRVVLKWSQGAFLSSAPLKVHCWVFDDEEEELLVFGKPFINKRRHYWEAAEAEEG